MGIDFYGLRRAKNLAKKQAREVSGDRAPFANGYRRALADLRATIDAEMKAENERELAARKPKPAQPAQP